MKKKIIGFGLMVASIGAFASVALAATLGGDAMVHKDSTMPSSVMMMHPPAPMILNINSDGMGRLRGVVASVNATSRACVEPNAAGASSKARSRRSRNSEASLTTMRRTVHPIAPSFHTHPTEHASFVRPTVEQVTHVRWGGSSERGLLLGGDFETVHGSRMRPTSGRTRHS